MVAAKDLEAEDQENNLVAIKKIERAFEHKVFMQRTLREESELIIKLKGFCPGNKIPRGLIIQGPEALKSGTSLFK